MASKAATRADIGFGRLLRRHRERAGLSQAGLAARARCSLFTVSKIERAAQEPTWPMALALTRALGVGVDAFVPVVE